MRVLLYCEWDRHAWEAEARADARPGLAPYGVEALARPDIDVRYWQPSPLLRVDLLRRIRLALEFEYLIPFARSTALTLSRTRPDVAVALLEPQGYLHAWLRGHGVRPWADVPLVLVSCWLAERARTASGRDLARLRTMARGVDLIVSWSAGQHAIYTDRLGVDADRLVSVPFGVETGFYRPAPGPGQGYVFSAGIDDGRDYRTLVAGLGRLAHPVKIACRPGTLDGLDLADNIETVGEVRHRAYRELLANASLVAVASRPEMAYPTGQSVILNAMAVQRPVLATATAPLGDYLRDGENCATVRPGDPAALAAAAAALLADPAGRARLGSAGRRDVEHTFNTEAMWSAIAEVLRSRFA